MRIGFWVINWPFKWSCRFPFCRYSYTRNLCFPSAQYPIKETRFGCSSLLKMSTSTRNSLSPSASLNVGRSIFLIATTFRLQKRSKFVCFSKTGFNPSLFCSLYYIGTKFAEGFRELGTKTACVSYISIWEVQNFSLIVITDFYLNDHVCVKKQPPYHRLFFSEHDKILLERSTSPDRRMPL